MINIIFVQNMIEDLYHTAKNANMIYVISVNPIPNPHFSLLITLKLNNLYKKIKIIFIKHL